MGKEKNALPLKRARAGTAYTRASLGCKVCPQPHPGQYLLLTLLALKLACLISYPLLLPFNPPKEPIKIYHVASLNGRGTLPSFTSTPTSL